MSLLGRVVEIRGASEGSGYLIGPGLVLTAWHVIQPPGEPLPEHVPVRVLRDHATSVDRLQPRFARLIWPTDAPGPDHDFALLQLSERAEEVSDSSVWWSELPDWEEVDVQAIGFPEFGKFKDPSEDGAGSEGERDTIAINGRVPSASGWKQRCLLDTGTFDVIIRQEDLPRDSHFRWEGMSGAAVFAGEILIGMIRSVTEVRPGLHRLHALPVSRLLNRDGVNAALRAAGLEPPRRSEGFGNLVDIGFTSELLDRFGIAKRAPSDFRAGAELFLSEYLGAPGRRVVFGGRRSMLEYLDNWLDDPAESTRLLLHAPGGRGKSALVVNWALGAAERCRILFLPVSVRSGTNLPRLFYQALAARLSELVEVELHLPISDDPVGHYRALATDLLRRLPADDKPVLLIIDGIDEAAGWSLPPALLPDLGHQGLRVLVSARERRGDQGAQGWLDRLGWSSGTAPRTCEVEPLDASGVHELLCSGVADTSDAEVSAQILRLSGGDPWIVKLYAEDLRGVLGGNARLRAEELNELQPGFGPFFKRWIDDQKELWRQREQVINEGELNLVLAVLACALGPLRHEDLAEVCRGSSGEGFTLSLQTLEPIDRFILGDGRHIGYVLTHPKLADYLLQEYFVDPIVLRQVRAGYFTWGRNVLAALESGALEPIACPPYLVSYLAQQLTDVAAPVEDFMRLVSRGWLRAWQASEGGHRGFLQDVRRASDTLDERAERDNRWWVWRLRCALVTSSIASLGLQFPPWLVVECARAGRLTYRQGFDWLEQQQNLEKSGSMLDESASDTARCDGMVSLAHSWPAEQGREQGLADLLHVARSFKSEWTQSRVFSSLVPSLPDKLIGEVWQTGLAMHSDESKLITFSVLMPRLTQAQRAASLRLTLTIKRHLHSPKTVEALAQSLPAEVRNESYALAASDIEARDGALARVRFLVSDVQPYVAEGKRASNGAKALDPDIQLASGGTDSSLDQAFDAAVAIVDGGARIASLSALANRLNPDRLREAARLIAATDAPASSLAHAFATVALNTTDPDERGALCVRVLTALDAVQDDVSMLHVLRKLVACAPDKALQRQWFGRTLQAITNLKDDYWRAHGLESLLQQSPSQMLLDDEALQFVAKIQDGSARTCALGAIVSHLPASLLPAAFELVRVIKPEFQRAKALAAMVPVLPDFLLAQAFETASEIADKGGGFALVALLPRLPDNLLVDAFATAIDIADESQRSRAMGLVVERMTEPALEELLQLLGKNGSTHWATTALVELAKQLPDALLPGLLRAIEQSSQVEALVAVAPRLSGDLIENALRVARCFEEESSRVIALAAIAPILPRPADRDKTLQEVLHEIDKIWVAHEQAEVLEKMLQHFPDHLLADVLSVIERISNAKIRARLLVAGARHWPETLVQEARRVARAISSTGARSDALAALASHGVHDTGRPEALEEAFKSYMTIGDDEARFRALEALLPFLTDGSMRCEAIAEALLLVERLEDPEARIRAYARLSEYELDLLRKAVEVAQSLAWRHSQALVESLPASRQDDLRLVVSEIPDLKERREAIGSFVKVLPAATRGPFLQLGLELDDESLRANFIRETAPNFVSLHLRDAHRTARNMREPFNRRWALEALQPHLPRSWIARLLHPRSRDGAAPSIEERLREVETFNDFYRARGIIDLAPSISEQHADELLRICRSVWNDSWRAHVLVSVVRYLPVAKRASALAMAAEISIGYVSGKAIGDMAGWFSGPLLDRAIEIVEEMKDWHGLTVAVTGMAPHLNDLQRARALKLVSSRLTSGAWRVSALTTLAAVLPPGQRRQEVLSDALNTAEALDGRIERTKALLSLLPHLDDSLKAPAAIVLLQAASGIARAHLLDALPVLLAELKGFENSQARHDAFEALRDVGKWFP